MKNEVGASSSNTPPPSHLLEIDLEVAQARVGAGQLRLQREERGVHAGTHAHDLSARCQADASAKHAQRVTWAVAAAPAVCSTNCSAALNIGHWTLDIEHWTLDIGH
jgi:hypothetical protein